MKSRLVVAALAAMLAIPAATAGAAPPGGHAFGDASNTGRQAGVGPATAGLAWETVLGVKLANEPGGSYLASNDLALFHGHATSDIPQTPEDESDDTRGVLYAIDPSDGSLAWNSPTLDIAYSCPGVATSDGRIIAQNTKKSPTHDSFDSSIVAIDAETGLRIPGQIYNGEDAGDGRLEECQSGDRLVLTDDESMVLVPGFFGSRQVRAIDIDPDSPSAFTQLWTVELVDINDSTSPPFGSRIMLSGDGTAFYIVIRWDPTTPVSEQVWRLLKYDLDGNLVAHVDLPGTAASLTARASLAADGGVVLNVANCDGVPADATNDTCLVFYDDDGGAFTERWRTYAPPEGGNNIAISLALMDEDTVGGFSNAGPSGAQGLAGFNLADGALEWTAATAFSNNGSQFITDLDGNGYFGGFGENHIRSVSPDGDIRWTVPFCHLQTGEPTIVGPIARDGTLITMRGEIENLDGFEVFRGFRTGATLPKGECPEETDRLTGVDRVETSVEISNKSFAAPDSSDVVVLATATNYPDALAGGPLARRLDAPLLLTAPDALSPGTRAEIERLGASRAVLLGGTAALSQAVENELVAMGLTIDRVAGTDRFATARLIADRVPATTVYVTEGANANPSRGWPDAVAVSALASFEQRPILLVTRDAVPQPTLDALAALNVTEVVVVGGEAAVSAAVEATLGQAVTTVTRETGPTRFATSVAIAERSVTAGASTFDLWFATGLAFPDALAAGPAVAKTNGILMLVHGRDTGGGPEVYEFLGNLSDDDVLRATFVGGPAAITDEVAFALLDAAGIG
jgi:putative cell wall-binding protein/outer membrane protein assembly factor BamB